MGKSFFGIRNSRGVIPALAWLVVVVLAAGGITFVAGGGCDASNTTPTSPTCPGGSVWNQCAASCMGAGAEHSDPWNSCMASCLGTPGSQK
ncbi:MAG: hypothetical protein PHD95_05360 [Candidatus ainarchaeum sp.]|nr:hypothetical protein [Candidatus ainarchaeum sp.]